MTSDVIVAADAMLWADLISVLLSNEESVIYYKYKNMVLRGSVGRA